MSAAPFQKSIHSVMKRPDQYDARIRYRQWETVYKEQFPELTFYRNTPFFN